VVLNRNLFGDPRFKAVIIVVIAVIALLFILFPSIFWDHFLWKYFWGPIVADAESVYTVYYNGVEATAGYNWINTATYALLTILALYIAYKHLRTGKESDFKKFFFSLIPLIIYGSIARVLEDADLFVSLPLRAFFISPLIYVQIFLLFISVVLTAVLLEKTKTKNLGTIFAIVAITIVIPFSGSFLEVGINPIYLVLVSFMSILLTFKFRSWHHQSFIFSLFLLLLALYYVFYWFMVEQWSYTKGTDPVILLCCLAIPFAVALVIFLIPFRFTEFLKDKLSLGSIFAQMLDASATYIGIDFFGYYEKHVLPSFLIGASESALVMFPIKLIIVVLVLYLLKDEKDAWINNIIKMMIIIFGLAPGTRDMLRIAMGV